MKTTTSMPAKIKPTHKNFTSFSKAAEPLIKWLGNKHPHMIVVVDCTSAELLEGQIRITNLKHLKD